MSETVCGVTGLGHSGGSEGTVQDSVGDKAKEAGGHGSRPGGLHRPVPELQRAYV